MTLQLHDRQALSGGFLLHNIQFFWVCPFSVETKNTPNASFWTPQLIYPKRISVDMSDEKTTVQQDAVVSIDYTLKDSLGNIIDSSEGAAPLEYLHGHNNLIPGLESELVGMSVGDEKKVVVAPEDAYGLRQEDATQLIPADAFPPDMEVEPGIALEMRDTTTNQVFEVYVTEVRPEGVVVDFNHPLAGESLHFDVKIVDIRPASPDEIAHGHVHSSGHHHH
jgi:FKBP-type peptidyl-prolyl cis-trans isomerase SlyD